ncbi:BQ5605_C034g11342 [Microbotryum silenes-dioicae]|uniref:Translation initiation factor IF-2, mitochondrial n=1 Tax=Microbotryum silenes-dioicae TaxID=796604 RepID=A0A2X0PB65_9BASI|nr:BQ5605_C034g11342 [Microbotryum silenes-dioicae]
MSLGCHAATTMNSRALISRCSCTIASSRSLANTRHHPALASSNLCSSSSTSIPAPRPFSSSNSSSAAFSDYRDRKQDRDRDRAYDRDPRGNDQNRGRDDTRPTQSYPARRNPTSPTSSLSSSTSSPSSTFSARELSAQYPLRSNSIKHTRHDSDRPTPTLQPRVGRALREWQKLSPEERKREDRARERLLRTMSPEKLYALERERARLIQIKFEKRDAEERQRLLNSAKNVGATGVVRRVSQLTSTSPPGNSREMVPGRVNSRLLTYRNSDRNAVPPVVRGGVHPSSSAQRRPARKQPRALKKVTLPTTVRLENLTRILGVRLPALQKAMQRIGLDNVRPERLLTAEDASLVALELNFDPTVDDEAAFDLYPLPVLDEIERPLRPPITGIFGHVDHGKTSLLDALRQTTVAKGEAGGITQHIGAFEVEVDAIVRNLSNGGKDGTVPTPSSIEPDSGATITFLDTPGHAAFTAMRERGASVTDVVVLVVAADDGVKPQTEEVIGLIKSADVGVVVAITKVDKPGVDTLKVKQELMAAGVEIEDFGGDIPCVEVSSVTGQGLPTLVETISAIAEIRELRAERSGRVEGCVIESRVEKGRGNVATVLVMRGCLRASASLVAGTTWCRVRSLIPPTGKAVSLVYPGQPIEVTGWKDLPSAGDLVLEAVNEDEAKRAVTNRVKKIEQQKLWEEVEVINEKRKVDSEVELIRREEEAKAKAKGLHRNAAMYAGQAAVEELTGGEGAGVKELILLIKADVSGTVEAVVGSLQGIGNSEAKVKIVSSGVGDVQESDIEMARAIGGAVVAFNVRTPASVMKLAARPPHPVAVYASSIIYRLVDVIRTAVADLLPKTIEVRVHGEALVQQLFSITIKGVKVPKVVAGSKISNGVFQKTRKARVVRNGEVIFTGTVDTLKHVKKDVTELTKGVECGIALEGFEGFQEQDLIQSIEEIEVARTL